MKKHLRLIPALLLAIALTFVFILYYRGFETHDYTCQFKNCTIILHSKTNSNSLQHSGYQLRLTIINKEGVNRLFELKEALKETATIEAVTFIKNGTRQEFFIVSTPWLGSKLIIDKIDLKASRYYEDLSNYGIIESKKLLTMPQCIKSDNY